MAIGPRYAEAMASSRAGAVLVPAALEGHVGPATRIVVTDPARAMALAATALHAEPHDGPSIASTARIGRDTTLAADARIGEYAVIGANVRIGARVRIAAHVVVEDDAVLGDDVRLDAHVTVYRGATLGDRVWCKAAAVIGGAGYGFVSDATGHARTPQVGGCILGDDVEIGSGSCVDRGSLDDTTIGRGTKIDNHVHVGHNVRIGEHCLLMAGVGIAGSTQIGDRVVLAGQAGLVGHITIGDDARIGAKAAVIASVPAKASVWGMPARPHREYLRAMAALYKLAPIADALETLVNKEHDDG